MSTNFRLVLQSGVSIGTEYPLEKPEIILGRDPSNDLVINDPEVSRRHARFVLEGNSYRIEDLGSTNGTFIQGQRVTMPFLLRPGELITLGEKVLLRFEMTVSDPNATVVAPRGGDRGTQPHVVTPVTPVTPTPMAAPLPPAPAAPINSTPVQNYQPIPATPVYAQPSIPGPQPVQASIPPGPVAPKKKSSALVILLILVGILVLFCVIPMIIIDATQSYCSLFPRVTNFFTSMLYGTIGCP